jgi:hypothetical protein
VELDQPGLISGWLSNTGLQRSPSGPPYAASEIDLYAGQSGRVEGQVNGALLQLGDQTWQWLDCWELGATNPGLAPGDSGALGVSPTGPHSIFGHFVGGAIATRGSGFTHHWVQDLSQVLLRQPALASQVVF